MPEPTEPKRPKLPPEYRYRSDRKEPVPKLGPVMWVGSGDEDLGKLSENQLYETRADRKTGFAGALRWIVERIPDPCPGCTAKDAEIAALITRVRELEATRPSPAFYRVVKLFADWHDHADTCWSHRGPTFECDCGLQEAKRYMGIDKNPEREKAARLTLEQAELVRIALGPNVAHGAPHVEALKQQAGGWLDAAIKEAKDE